jgi:hypothetical protein
MIQDIKQQDIKHILLLSVIFVLIIMTYMIYKICDSDDSLDYYIYDTKKNGPTIVMIGGTHGNEPIGSIAIKNLIKKINDKTIILEKGKLILIPSVNYCALRLNIRMIPGLGDMNRKYPKIVGINNTDCPIINKILDLIKDADFILDFHEGWGFHRKTKRSMGSTITPTNTNISNDLSEIIYENINKIIVDDYKKFKIFVNDNRYLSDDNRYSQLNDIKGSLRYYTNINRKNYVLIEITGQNNVQPLQVRKQQTDLIINIVLEYFNLI